MGVGVTTDKQTGRQAVVTTSRDPLGLVITMKTTAAAVAAAAVQNHLVHSTVQCRRVGVKRMAHYDCHNCHSMLGISLSRLSLFVAYH